MFNLNESNRIVMSQYPTDMRKGVNTPCGQVRMSGLDPTNGDVYVFVGRSRQVMKLLHWEHGGCVMYYKRLEQDRFHPRIFLRQGVGSRSMRWTEPVLLMEGISLRVARRHRYAPDPTLFDDFFKQAEAERAEDNAVFCSLPVSCEDLGVPPLERLTRTLERIKPDMDEEQLTALLPYNYKADAS